LDRKLGESEIRFEFGDFEEESPKRDGNRTLVVQPVTTYYPDRDISSVFNYLQAKYSIGLYQSVWIMYL